MQVKIVKPMNLSLESSGNYSSIRTKNEKTIV